MFSIQFFMLIKKIISLELFKNKKEQVKYHFLKISDLYIKWSY